MSLGVSFVTMFGNDYRDHVVGVTNVSTHVGQFAARMGHVYTTSCTNGGYLLQANEDRGFGFRGVGFTFTGLVFYQGNTAGGPGRPLDFSQELSVSQFDLSVSQQTASASVQTQTLSSGWSLVYTQELSTTTISFLRTST